MSCIVVSIGVYAKPGRACSSLLLSYKDTNAALLAVSFVISECVPNIFPLSTIIRATMAVSKGGAYHRGGFLPIAFAIMVNISRKPKLPALTMKRSASISDAMSSVIAFTTSATSTHEVTPFE